MTGHFDTPFEDLPAELAVFPLPRVILLPRVQLPLNIFEPRYLAMVDDAMKSQRLIGMVQPALRLGDNSLYEIGCAGRITSFDETEDGRYLITLKGAYRFRVLREISTAPGGYRRVHADWSMFKNDAVEDTETDVCRDTMMRKLQGYFTRMNMVCEQWDQIKNISCERLISTLCLVCPFEAEDKQTLLEAKDLATRARLLQALIDMAVSGEGTKQGAVCH